MECCDAVFDPQKRGVTETERDRETKISVGNEQKKKNRVSY